MDLFAGIVSPGMTIAKTMFGDIFSDSEEKGSKGTPHFDFGTYNKDEITYMINNGIMNKAQQEGYAAGIDRMDINGNAVDSKGNPYSDDPYRNTDLYNDEENQRVNSFFTTPYQRDLSEKTGMDFGGNRRGAFTPNAYQTKDGPNNQWKRGDYLTGSGQVTGGMAPDFEDLIRTNPDLAREIVDKTKGRISPTLIRKLELAERSRIVKKPKLLPINTRIEEVI